MSASSTQPLRITRGLTKRTAPSFGVYAERWFTRQQVSARRGLLRISSLHRYESALRAHLLPFFAARRVDRITRDHCDAYRAAAVRVGRLNPATVNSLVQILRLILRAAHRDGLIPRDPLAGMRPLLVSPRILEPYHRGEIDRLLAATPVEHRLTIALAALAGLRQGEVYAIRLADIDRANHRIIVRRSVQRHHRDFTLAERFGPPKTTAGFRQVPIQSALADRIHAHIELTQPDESGLLCPGSSGAPHVPIQFQRRVYAPAIRRAGLWPMRFHDLRRSFIGQCVSAGIPVAQTAAWLGHSIRMTQYYYSVTQTELLAAIAALDADSAA